MDSERLLPNAGITTDEFGAFNLSVPAGTFTPYIRVMPHYDSYWEDLSLSLPEVDITGDASDVTFRRRPRAG